MINIYEEMKNAGIEIDHHETDLYAVICDKSRAILDRYRFKGSVLAFTGNDSKRWYDIPFAYTPELKRRYNGKSK